MENKDTLKDKDIIKKKEPITRVIEAPNIDLNDELTKKIYEVLLATGAAQPAGTVVTLGATTMTEHIELNQWEPEDVPIRMDFNDDNLKIDTAFYELNENLSDKISTLSTDLSIESDEEGGTRWVRFPDGTQIIYGRVSVSGAINVPMGALFRANDLIVTSFPVPFILAPRVTLTAIAGILQARLEGAPTINSFSFQVFTTGTLSAGSRFVDYIAIGRWR